MRRWEAFDLAAQIQAAETQYRLRAIHLRRARDEHHEVIVEDTRDGATFVVRSADEWRDRLGLPRLGTLAQRIRWDGDGPRLRRDLVSEYEELAVGLDVEPRPVRDTRELRRAVEGLIERASRRAAAV
jgi:hypothetical protein